MANNMALSKAEQNALAVSYDVLGTHVELDLQFVKQYLVRGRADLTTDQELVFFMNTCKMQGLNPLVQGEVYLIKYSKDDPAQMVVGKDAYLRRAHEHPDYLYKQDGIVVQRGENIIQKEGCWLIKKSLGKKSLKSPTDVLWDMIDEENSKGSGTGEDWEPEPNCIKIEAWEEAISRIRKELF